MIRLTAYVAIPALVFLVNTPLEADDGTADEQARTLFKEGIRLFKEGEFEGASIAFNRAYELRPSYKILFNVGQVETELKHYCRAVKAFSEYLEIGGDEIDAERRQEVTEHIRRLEILIGSVAIQYGEDGVIVLIDEERKGVTPLESPLCVNMGTHDLSLRKGIEEIYRETLRIAGGQTLTLDLGGEEEPPAPVAAAVEEKSAEEKEVEEKAPEPASAPVAAPVEEKTPKADEAKPEKEKRKWTWVALGLGGAFGVAGGIVGGISRSKESDLKSRCDGKQCDSADEGEADTISRMNLTADILFGAAALSAAAGVVLFFIEPKRNEKPVAVVPAGPPGGIGFSVEGRF